MANLGMVVPLALVILLRAIWVTAGIEFPLPQHQLVPLPAQHATDGLWPPWPLV